MPKATAVFDADDSRLSGALARINGKMLALQSRMATAPTPRRMGRVDFGIASHTQGCEWHNGPAR